MPDGKSFTDFLEMSAEVQNLYLYQEMQELKGALGNLLTEARRNGKTMWKIGLLITGSVLSGVVSIWAKG